MDYQQELENKCLDIAENLLLIASNMPDKKILIQLEPNSLDPKEKLSLLITMCGKFPFYQLNETYKIHELDMYEHACDPLNSVELLELIRHHIRNFEFYISCQQQKPKSDDSNTVHLTTYQVNSLKRLQYLVKQHELITSRLIAVDIKDQVESYRVLWRQFALSQAAIA
ncbi:hypothetical protein [Nitrincola sp.]|uniref:hypothetical protein n=1 Tax=Nitrincola sp. TaxID=1926584 RepID=UPI003A9297C3